MGMFSGFVKICAVQFEETVGIFAKMSWNPIHYYGYAGAVQFVARPKGISFSWKPYGGVTAPTT